MNKNPQCWTQPHRNEFTFTLILCLMPIRGRMYSWNFTSGISGTSGSAEGAFALVGGIFTLSPGGFSPLESSFLVSPVSMSQSWLLPWKTKEVHCSHPLSFLYLYYFLHCRITLNTLKQSKIYRTMYQTNLWNSTQMSCVLFFRFLKVATLCFDDSFASLTLHRRLFLVALCRS